jgi:lysophospholipase L1-like esterase
MTRKAECIIYAAGLVVVALIFTFFYLRYQTSVGFTAGYATCCAVALLLVFAGEYGKAALITLALLFFSQPMMASYLHPNLVTLLPNYTAIARPDASLRGLDAEITMSTDAHGYRTTAPDAYARPRKIFSIGGSTTAQVYIDDRKTTSARLEALIGHPSYAVINTGVPGTRTIQHVKTMREIAKYHPHAAIILVGVNDWMCALRTMCWDLPAMQFDPRYWPLTHAAQYVWNRGIGAPPRETARRYPSHAKAMGRYNSKPKYAYDDDAVKGLLKRYRRDFAELIRTCEGIGTTCVVATQPHSYTAENFRNPAYVRTLWMTPSEADWAVTPDSLMKIAAAFNEHTRTHATCAKCLMIDLQRLMRGNPEFFFDDVHFTNKGGAFVADALAAFLRQHKVVP